MSDKDYQEQLEIVLGYEPRISDYQEQLEIVAMDEPNFHIINIETEAINFFYHLKKILRAKIAFKKGIDILN